MRGYAVLLVFLVHHHTLFGDLLPRSGLLYPISGFGHDIGHSGVDLFFVLSGFLIYGHLLRRCPPYFCYLRKRIRRLYPAFLLIFGIYVVASICIPFFSKLPHEAGAAGLYLLANALFLPGIFPIEPLITVTWSLSYEFLFYLAIPLLIGALALRRRPAPFRTALFTALLVGDCVGCYFGMPHPRMGLFAAGILAYEATASAAVREKLSAGGESIAIGAYAALLLALVLFEWSTTHFAFHPHFPNRQSPFWTLFLSVGLFGLTVYATSFDGISRAFFSARPLRWLGNMSYTYFLSHGMILNGIWFLLRPVFRPGSFSPLAFTVLLVMNLGLTLVASLVFFVLVERRFSLTRHRLAGLRAAEWAARDSRVAISAGAGQPD